MQNATFETVEVRRTEEFQNLNYNLLSDYRDAYFIFDMNEVGLVWDFLFSIEHILKGKKGSVITDKPLTTAIAMIFEHDIYKKIGFNIRTFSTESAALHWLSI